MKIELKKDLCMAHGTCVVLAPEYFESGQDGFVALVPGAEALGDKPALRLAESSCPMQVIEVIEGGRTAELHGAERW